MQDTLSTDRLLLRPRTLADLDACLAMDREPGVVRYVAGPYPPGQGYWTVAPRDAPNAFLGWVLLIPEGAVGPEIEIGWRLRPEAWGAGIATEAARGFSRTDSTGSVSTG